MKKKSIYGIKSKLTRPSSFWVRRGLRRAFMAALVAGTGVCCVLFAIYFPAVAALIGLFGIGLGASTAYYWQVSHDLDFSGDIRGPA